MGSSAATPRDYCLRGDGRAQKLRKASGTPSLVNLFTATSAVGPGCVKTRSGKGGAESFSQLPSSESSCQHKPTLTSTKSRWKFYTEVGHRSFHTAWVKRRNTRCEQMFSALPPRPDIAQCGRHVRFVPRRDSCTAAISSLIQR